jgi:alkyl sulfatase BDS1-like metallo-beta-lactamase superfamily hydrolase
MMDNAVEVLKNYRDAMRWVHDRTIEGAKQFLTPDELVVASPRFLVQSSC